MKILFTCHYHRNLNAGAFGVTWRLGQEYQRLGNDVEYYSLDDLPQKLHPLAKVAAFPEFVAHRATTLARKSGLDVIDASTGDGWIWSTLQRMRENPPLMIARCHGLEHIEHLEYLEERQRGNMSFGWKYHLYRGSVRLWEAAASMRCADLLLLLNRRDRDYAVEQLKVKPERVHIVPNGIAKEFLNLPFEPLSDAPLRIAQIGTYILRKGVHYAAPALNTILARHPQVTVSFLGTECPIEQVHADFDPALRDRVNVVPTYANGTLPSLLQGHHIKLFPTISEGFGVALIEAMACGLAPITTATPGPMEIVRDGQDAIVIPCRDQIAIEQALERLLTNRPYLERLRRHAYETAQSYSWSSIAQNNLSFYERAYELRRSTGIIA